MSRKVVYALSQDAGNYHFGPNHLMKPIRYSITTDLVFHYGMNNKMQMFRPKGATIEEMSVYHDVNYLNFLKSVSGTPSKVNKKDQILFNILEDADNDCPIFGGMFDFCSTYTGLSIEGAKLLGNNDCSIAVNWSGGLHHAKKSSAYGFCYVNDIVLAIMKLLENFERVLYIDIDVHHGDGVQDAFYNTNRVMTVSFHQFVKDFFPGTGDLNETGEGTGVHCSINIPLLPGINDSVYVEIFENVIGKIMSSYCPSAIVLQCGADSLAKDRIGAFNLSIRGHGRCVEFVRNQNVPLLVLGGGGYKVQNVARCWAYETSVLLGCELDNNIPSGSNFFSFFTPEPILHPTLVKKRCKNHNTKQYVHKVLEHAYDNIKKTEQAPSVQFSLRNMTIDDNDVIEDNSDIRMSEQQRDQHIEPENEYYDGDEDQDGNFRKIHQHLSILEAQKIFYYSLRYIFVLLHLLIN